MLYTLDFNTYTGRYKDDWFGEVVIYEKENKLWFKSSRSLKLNGEMKYYKANTFAVAMEYMDCDAFVMFQLDENSKGTSISMKGISPDIDFSFDYQDLDLKRTTQ